MKIEIQPRASISGRVLDEYSDPMQNVNVQVTPVSPDASVAFSLSKLERADGRSRRIPDPRRGRAVSRQGDDLFGGESRERDSHRWHVAAGVCSDVALGRSLDGPARAVTIAVGAEARGVEIRISSTSGGKGGGPVVDGVVTGAPDDDAGAFLWPTTSRITRMSWRTSQY